MNTDNSLKIGSRRYEIIEELGHGSYGKTYLAKDLHLPEYPTCVVKKFAPQDRSHDNFALGLRLFEQEAKILYKLGKHDQIPHLLAYFLDDEECEFFLVQEFIDGKDLTEEIQNRLEEAEVVQLLIDILEVLDYVHSQGVIHRDLKPSNIRLRNDEKIVLIDFGAVKEVSLIEGSNISSTVGIGTQGYIPSEQAGGRPRFASDIYSVGMIAIQALTGISPRDLDEDNSTGEVLWKHHVNISKDLEEILARMVRYHFSSRYQTVIEVLADLNRIQSHTYVDIVSKTRETLNSLVYDVRMIRGGIVLPMVRRFLIDKIDNFENLYTEYSSLLEDKKLSTFLHHVCEETIFNVDPIHPAKLSLNNNTQIENTIHSESSYRHMLMTGQRKFKLNYSKCIFEVARQISKASIDRQNFSEILELMSNSLPSIKSEYLRDSLLAFWAADCFETEPEFGLPWNRSWTLKSGFTSEEALLESLRYGVRNKLKDILIEIDEVVDEDVLKKILP
jgi:serine/threonine protein kinase